MSASIIVGYRLELLRSLAKQGLRELPGDVAEVGVYKGGSAKLLAKLFPTKVVHLFDTFCGMPDIACEHDNYHKAGDFADTSLDQVKHHLVDCFNVVLYPGVFPDTANASVTPLDQFVLVHVDCDLFRSVLNCCEFFYPRLTVGGVLVFDDYHEDTCLGAKKAVDQFFADKPEQLVLDDRCCFVRKLQI